MRLAKWFVATPRPASALSVLLLWLGLSCAWAGPAGASVFGVRSPATAGDLRLPGSNEGQGVYQATAGPDGNVWFTEHDANRVGHVTRGGQFKEFSEGISAGARPFGIVLGADRNLWFTEPGIDQVARVTPNGDVTEYGTGVNINATPWAIALGEDGNVWFTEPGTGSLGRVGPDGTVTEFGLLAAGVTSEATGIVAGPDGAMWITLPTLDAVARFPLDTRIPALYREGITPGAAPHSIAVGADGNLWFTEGGRNAVGRITPAGVVTEFGPVMAGSTKLDGIARGPNGDIWFVDSHHYRLGRITPEGIPTEFWGGIDGWGLTLGPDQHLWTPSYHTIWRVDPSDPPMPVVAPFRVSPVRDRAARIVRVKVRGLTAHAEVTVTALGCQRNCTRLSVQREDVGTAGTATLRLPPGFGRRGADVLRVSVYISRGASVRKASYGRFTRYRVSRADGGLAQIASGCMIRGAIYPCPLRPT